MRSPGVTEGDGEKDDEKEVTTRVSAAVATARWKIACKGLLSKSKSKSKSPCLLFLTKDALLIHKLGVLQQEEAEEEGGTTSSASSSATSSSTSTSWVQVGIGLPHADSLITNAWSAGPHLLILLGSTLAPFDPGHLCLWNPLSLSPPSPFPPFASIWHLITLGFAHNMVVAAGFDRNIQCVIEIYHLNHTSPTWRVIGRLPFAFNVQEHDEILYCDGSFYALCMESSMLVIDPHEPMLRLIHDIPCPSAPKLISSHNCIFLVDEDYLSDSFALWRYDKTEERWQAIPVDSPFQSSSLKIIGIKGVGMSICFILSNLSVMVYDLLKGEWHSLLDCPSVPSSKALTWEPRVC